MQYCNVKIAWKYMPKCCKVCTYMNSPLYKTCLIIENRGHCTHARGYCSAS